MGDEVETLLQRFLDAELTRAERQALLRLLGSRPDVRQRLLDDEAMLDAVASLPRAALSPDFVARTLAILPEQTVDVADDATPTPRPVRRWVPAAVAASLLLASGFWLGREYGTSNAPAVATTAPASSTEVLVRLVLIEPGARTVAVVGDFNGWDPGQTPLQRMDGGVWSTTVPVAPGRYHYMFLVDGKEWLADPLAAETSVDGFGAQNSVLDVEL